MHPLLCPTVLHVHSTNHWSEDTGCANSLDQKTQAMLGRKFQLGFSSSKCSPSTVAFSLLLPYPTKVDWCKKIDTCALSSFLLTCIQGSHQIGKAISMPSVAVLAGLLLTVSFSMSHSTVQVQGIDWMEPVLLWIAICMPIGSGKSALCKFLKSLYSG